MEIALISYIICINYIPVLSNYTFYEVVAFNSQERDVLYRIQERHNYISFLNDVTNEASTIMHVVVNSCCTKEFEQRLSKYDIEYSCVTDQVLPPLNDGQTDNLQHQSISQSFFDWDNILEWVDNKIKENSALTKTVIAKTYEHRDIFVLKLSTEKAGNKMAVFVVAGEEGRDWLSSAILLNYINEILESASSPESLLKLYELYFVPIINPDGFVYTKQNDRMWAKNRKLIEPPHICENNDTVAVGVNIDKNWFTGKSDSNYVCNSIYAGSQSLSEEETQGLSYILNSIALKLLAFISLRGFGNLIALPYSNNNKVSTNHNIVIEIMQHVSAVLKMEYNKSYPVGTTANYFYNLSGTMPDWIKQNLNIPIVLTVYMQHDNFLPKESHIKPLTEQFQLLLNMTLSISKEIYGSLYNKQMMNASTFNLITGFILLCACSARFYGKN